MDKYRICVSFGNSIKTWDFDNKTIRDSKQKSKSKEHLFAKILKNKEMMADFKESYTMMEEEKKIEEINKKNTKKYNGQINELLTEQEMLDYAILLSQEANKSKEEEEIAYLKQKEQELEQQEIKYDIQDDDLIYETYGGSSSITPQITNTTSSFENMSLEEDIYNNNYSNNLDKKQTYSMGNEENELSKKGKEKQKEKSVEEEINDFINDGVNNSTSTSNYFDHEINSTAKNDNNLFEDEFMNNNFIQMNDDINYYDSGTMTKNMKKINNKNKKKSKKKNFVSLDEWEETQYNQQNDFSQMSEEEYLNYVLQLSMHDK